MLGLILASRHYLAPCFELSCECHPWLSLWLPERTTGKQRVLLGQEAGVNTRSNFQPPQNADKAYIAKSYDFALLKSANLPSISCRGRIGLKGKDCGECCVPEVSCQPIRSKKPRMPRP
jgi:hypothetical protein